MCVASPGFGFEVTPVSCTLKLCVLSSSIHGLLFTSDTVSLSLSSGVRERLRIGATSPIQGTKSKDTQLRRTESESRDQADGVRPLRG